MDIVCSLKKAICVYAKDKQHYSKVLEPICNVQALCIGEPTAISKIKKCPLTDPIIVKKMPSSNYTKDKSTKNGLKQDNYQKIFNFVLDAIIV